MKTKTFSVKKVAIVVLMLLFTAMPFSGFAKTTASKTISSRATTLISKETISFSGIKNIFSDKTNISKNRLSASVVDSFSGRINNDELLGQLSFWVGKVNMRKEIGGEWKSDPDQTSGFAVHRLNYCKKFWPEADYIEQIGIETISGWQDAGGIGNYTSTKPIFGCFDGETEQAWQDDVAVTPIPANPNEYKVLVVLADYLDSEYSDSLSVSEAENWFTGYPLGDFFREQSYGNMDISADVIGWYTRQMNGEGSGCNPTALSNSGNFSSLSNQELIDYLNQYNVSFSDYDHMVVVVDCKGTTWGGYSQELTLNGESIPAAVVKGVGENGPSFHFVAHEMGHDLYGIHTGHANGLDCESTDYNAPDCNTVNYGNYYDAMGSWQEYSHHFRAQLKDQLGWFNQSQVVEVTHSGTYTINPLETVGGVKMVKINPWYAPDMTHYVEFRSGYGFNSNLLQPSFISNTQGLFVYKKSKGSGSVYNLIDATPTAASWGDDIVNTTLNPSMTFQDDIWGVSIQTLSASQNEITFQVVLNESDYIACDGPSLAPVNFILDPSELPSLSPQSGESSRHYLSVGISLDDPEPTCLNQEHEINLVSAGSLNVDLIPSTKTVYLEGERKWYVPIGIPENLPEGAYQVQFSLTNLGTGQISYISYIFSTSIDVSNPNYEEVGFDIQ